MYKGQDYILAKKKLNKFVNNMVIVKSFIQLLKRCHYFESCSGHSLSVYLAKWISQYPLYSSLILQTNGKLIFNFLEVFKLLLSIKCHLSLFKVVFRNLATSNLILGLVFNVKFLILITKYYQGHKMVIYENRSLNRVLQ